MTRIRGNGQGLGEFEQPAAKSNVCSTNDTNEGSWLEGRKKRAHAEALRRGEAQGGKGGGGRANFPRDGSSMAGGIAKTRKGEREAGCGE